MMGVISGFHHVKLPVADVSRSRDWYGRVLGFQVALEFVEDGVVMGLALRDPSGSFLDKLILVDSAGHRQYL
jgi:catechol 2,3-dioxygenase-like lactoylglutathione lyase family enzyme